MSRAAIATCVAIVIWVSSVRANDPLPSWNDGPAKQSIIDFVQQVTTAEATSYVPPAERIAVFDNDGTLWSENPLPFQLAFLLDQLKRRVDTEPELANDPMVKAALAGDFAKLLAGQHHDGLLHIAALTHTGMTTDEFDQSVKRWADQAIHPRFQRPYLECVYQPMLELLDYLRGHEFKTFIVSGGGADFMRVWSEQVYGIPPEQVVGTTARTRYEMRDGKPVLVKTSESLFVDDKEGKPVGIHQFIGRRPIACFGNSDGDQAMLEYTTIGNPRPSFGLIVHHTDAEREYAYDAQPSSSGKLTTALADAPQRNWTIVDMKSDWKQIFPESAADSGDSAEKLTGVWLVEDIDRGGVIDRAQTTIEIKADGTVSGSGGVNRYSGQATIAGDQIKFGPLAATRRAGPPAVMNQEAKFFAAMSNVTGFRIAETGLLYLTDADGRDVIRGSRLNQQ
jgi:heat shock protein HslJ/phosphoglycolate phosphatase-like HAD superfamily hydrolase